MMKQIIVSCLLLGSSAVLPVGCFTARPAAAFVSRTIRNSCHNVQNLNNLTTRPMMRHITSTIARSSAATATDDDEEEMIIIPTTKAAAPLLLPNMERAWRHVKKPLLSIGGKGATLSHGNSLRQLLDAHTVVKIKINTKQFENSLQVAFEALKRLAMEAGSDDIELLQVREKENVILVGAQGTRALIEAGKFPPAKPVDESAEPTAVSKGNATSQGVLAA